MNRVGDIVLIYYQEKPATYARIEAIEPDVKKAWYQVTLLLLTFPAQRVTWILREEYINGAPFTMGGQSMRLEEVRAQVPKEGQKPPSRGENGPRRKGAKVISFRKKNSDPFQ